MQVLRAPRHVFVACWLLLALAACKTSSLRDMVPTKSSVDADAAIQNLSAIEHETEFGFFEFIYSAKAAEEDSVARVTRGQLLVNDTGSFKFEKPGRGTGQRYWVSYQPGQEIVVAFPDSKTAYTAPASLLEDPEAAAILAAYDGLRVFLNLDEVWNNPTGVGMETHPGGASFQKPGRPFQWKIRFAESQSPFENLRAFQGLKLLAEISRKEAGYKAYDQEASRTYMTQGKDAGGQSVSFDIWELSIEGTPAPSQIQITPYPATSLTREAAAEQLAPIQLQGDIQVKSLTLAQVKRWLNLR